MPVCMHRILVLKIADFPTPTCTHSCAIGRSGSLSELSMIGSEAPSVRHKKT